MESVVSKCRASLAADGRSAVRAAEWATLRRDSVDDGKMELEYEGEQLGANRIARDLIKRAAGEIFEGYFVGIDFSRTGAVV
jgi:magnesium chelatase subunit I